jgi:hypothetical protein
MLFASRSKINSTRFRRSLASASPTVTPPPSAFPCAVSSPCVTVDRARRIVAAPRGAWTCDLSIGVAASIPGTFGLQPNVIERQPAWSVLGADPLAVPALLPDPRRSRQRRFEGSTPTSKKYDGSGSVRTLCSFAWAWQPRSLRASPEPPSGQ